jgi:predicted HicB family RNase H-like nuclease
MRNGLKHLSFRINPELLKKFNYVAAYDDRSMNWYMTKMIQACVDKFEVKHGKIELDEEETKS